MPPSRKAKRPVVDDVDPLEAIFGGMKRTHAKLTARPVGSRAGAADDGQMEIASHYMMMRPAPAAAPGAFVNKMACRNVDCGRTEFETDMRQGDRICVHCGAVQNVRSVESLEEEKRTFADDDDKDKNVRTSQDSGIGGGAVGNASLGQAQKIAQSFAEGRDGLTDERIRKKLDAYKEKVRKFSDHFDLQGEIPRAASEYCDQLVSMQVLHEKECGHKGNGSCRLVFKHRSPAVVAAAVLKVAMQRAAQPTDRLVEELKSALKDDDVDAADAKKVGGRCCSRSRIYSPALASSG